MKKNLLTIFSISMIVLAFSVFSYAQQESRTASAAASKYVISADAGGVNFIEGRVAISRPAGRSGLLLKGDQVRIGDKISTEADGKAEILLNPGSYIRLGGNSSFEFVETSLENLQINLHRGSAMFEVITTNNFTFAVNTPKATFNVIRSGVYRIDVMDDGTGKIEVWSGRAQIGDDDTTVKKGRTATVGGEDDVAVARFSTKERDNLEEWSRTRARELAKANERLERNVLRSTLLSSFSMNRWSLYDSYGLWVYDPFFGGNTFLPFGYGWSSPYGFGFRRDIWYYRLPTYIYYYPPRNINPPVNNPNPGGNPTTGGNPNADARTENRNRRSDSGNTSRPVPPFEQVDRDNGRSRVERNTGVEVPNFPSRSMPRVVVPSTSAPTGIPTQTGGRDSQRP